MESKFNKLVSKILNEDNNLGREPIANTDDSAGYRVHRIDMEDSVGWDIDSGILEGRVEPGHFDIQSVQFVDFNEGANDVLQHAKRYKADPKEIQLLKQKLLRLKKAYSTKDDQYSFFTFSMETDVSLGVVSNA